MGTETCIVGVRQEVGELTDPSRPRSQISDRQSSAGGRPSDVSSFVQSEANFARTENDVTLEFVGGCGGMSGFGRGEAKPISSGRWGAGGGRFPVRHHVLPASPDTIGGLWFTGGGRRGDGL
jgi:hypothetical protein